MSHFNPTAQCHIPSSHLCKDFFALTTVDLTRYLTLIWKSCQDIRQPLSHKAPITPVIIFLLLIGMQPAKGQSQGDLHHSIQYRSTLNDTNIREDKPIAKLSLDQFELQGNNGATIEGDFSYGTDESKISIEVDYERTNGETDENELWGVYSRSVSANWNVLTGIRHDFQLENTSRNWFAIGVIGETPYSFEMDAVLFFGRSGSTALRIEGEYTFKISEKVSLVPRAELDFFGQNDASVDGGSGLSEIEIGVRLRYEIHPKFSPYIGIHQYRNTGNTADFEREEGEMVYDTVWVLGFRAWL
ncbi:copper resistance protein B [Microbulbifer sp. MLAF003]|uniref:copper resistance protein B n=1 Tax=Microbulbifer TaxID=48073 RepID=UPI00039DC0D0|nr:MULTISPECIES: copper resistance protein B [Microbulbifer]WHI51812.1 copper resistance protein B [Microbulbifer sp. MLAF003]